MTWVGVILLVAFLCWLVAKSPALDRWEERQERRDREEHLAWLQARAPELSDEELDELLVTLLEEYDLRPEHPHLRVVQ